MFGASAILHFNMKTTQSENLRAATGRRSSQNMAPRLVLQIGGLCIAFAGVNAHGEAAFSPDRMIEAIGSPTPCEWIKEVKSINTWLEREQYFRRLIDDEYLQSSRAGIKVDAQKIEEFEAAGIKVDQEIQRELEEVIGRCGWLTVSNFGVRAAEATFFVLLHAPLAMQKKWFPVATRAKDLGEFPARLWAQLYDRISVNLGVPQLYGTQYAQKEGPPAPYPIEDPMNVNARRAEMGIIPSSICVAISKVDGKWAPCESGELK